MKVATYNILKGGARRNHWIKMLEDFAVDLVLVQESFPQHEHLPPLSYPNSQVRSVWEMVKQTGWGSAVVSQSGAMKPVSVPGFPGWCVGAEISGAAWQNGIADPLLVFSVHAPDGPGGYHGQVNKLLDEIARITGGRDVIIGGDFNLTVSHCPEPAPPGAKRDLDIQARLTDEFGLLNCWQAANPEQPLAQTLRWTGNRGIPWHCDGIFVPLAWKDRLRSCVVLAGEEWNSLSDHNPVIASFA